MDHTIKHLFDEHISLFTSYSEKDLANITHAANCIADTFLNGGKLYICGNGASSFMAKYAASLFVQHYKMARPPLPAIALSSDITFTLTDINDIYEKQITALATGSDVIWGIAADDKAEPVVRALRTAAQNNMKTIGLSSGKGLMTGVCDVLISAEHPEQLRVREMQHFIIHILCEMVEKIIFDPAPPADGTNHSEEDTFT